MQRYLFFAVTKGARPGVYSSWEEPNEQVSNYSFPEYHGFNSYEHTLQYFKSRMASIDDDKAVNAEMFGTQSEGVSGGKGVFPSGSSQRRGLVSWLPVIPQEELNPVPEFAIVNNMELWLVKICHDFEIPGPCFFKQERFLRESPPFYGFTVVIPGNPFEASMVAKGHFSLVEKAAREDAALEMLGRVLEITGKEIRDYNYFKVNLLRDSKNALRAKVCQLEEAYEKLKANYEALVSAHIDGKSLSMLYLAFDVFVFGNVLDCVVFVFVLPGSPLFEVRVLKGAIFVAICSAMLSRDCHDRDYFGNRG
ncbi:uncharacterized protein DS421_20g700240 [Arachis hypogaea]|nr:uncharacterized protein DS421_20g700240 [Arachis hypogaea]